MNKQLFIQDVPFNKSQFEPISNHLSRPEGGLWTADYSVEDGSTWLLSGHVDFEYSNPLGFVFNIKPEANILTLNTVQDALEILPSYLISTFIQAPTNLRGKEVAIGVYEIDFEKMSQTYDAISVSHDVANGEIQHNGKFSPFADWEIASTLWFNTNHLELVQELTTAQLKEKQMNTTY
ncbi:hypothetical protein [Bacillus sp. SRB_8]|uniref:hypothetical protein n=1 Tax=unclassified Bacillus (in: firmicutes) TaxID=185979 RepID=UPI000DC46ABA|nr:hypothetical protein [Bacillus sp. SRB_8]RAN68702.1 hypothetical protein B5P40_19565 [Bacillus sp. SRB_8]